MKTLQNQYTAITEGKGNKDHFLKQARHLFPELLTVNTTFNDAITILKGKNILTEAVGGIATQNPNKPDWFKIFNTNIKEAVGVKDKKEYGDQNTFEKIDKDVAKALESNFDNSDPKNIDNVYGQSFLIGYLAEMDDPKNAEKTVDELKQIVAKNMAKDINYYAKNGMFAVKGIGLETSTEPKAPKGKYKSSGYGDLKESYDYETQKDLKALAQDSNKLKDSNEVKKAAKFIGMNADDEDELGRLTKAYAKKHEITDSEAITHIIDQAYTIFKSRFSEMNEGLKKAFNKKLREPEINANPYSLYKSHPKFKEAEQAIAKALKTATKREDVENILKNYREAGADDTASRETIFAAFNKKLNESKLRSLVRNLIKEELNEGSLKLSDLKQWDNMYFIGDLDPYRDGDGWVSEDEAIAFIKEWNLEKAKAEAQRISQEEGVVQHVEETSEGSGEYRISDWYDSDLTVASYQNGMEL